MGNGLIAKTHKNLSKSEKHISDYNNMFRFNIEVSILLNIREVIMDNIELSIKAYIRARKRVDDGCEAYISICKDEGQNTIVLSEDIEPFASIRESISWAVSLYEKVDKSEKHEDSICFMSGVKFIDNIMKHNMEVFFLYSFCRPGIHISVKVEENDTGPLIEDIEMEPLLLFGEAENIKGRWKTQRENYSNKIQGKPVKTIMDELDKILRTFYSFEE